MAATDFNATVCSAYSLNIINIVAPSYLGSNIVDHKLFASNCLSARKLKSNKQIETDWQAALHPRVIGDCTAENSRNKQGATNDR